MNCRLATIDDAPALARVHVSAWQEAYDGLMPADILSKLDVQRVQAWWERAFREESRRVLVIEVRGLVVAFCLFGPSSDADATSETGEIIAMNLHPDYWRRGLGSHLLTEVMAQLRKAGFAEATLWVLHNNQRARTFYEILGFEAYGGDRVESKLTGSPLHEVRYHISLKLAV